MCHYFISELLSQRLPVPARREVAGPTTAQAVFPPFRRLRSARQQFILPPGAADPAYSRHQEAQPDPTRPHHHLAAASGSPFSDSFRGLPCIRPSAWASRHSLPLPAPHEASRDRFKEAPCRSSSLCKMPPILWKLIFDTVASPMPTFAFVFPLRPQPTQPTVLPQGAGPSG